MNEEESLQQLRDIVVLAGMEMPDELREEMKALPQEGVLVSLILQSLRTFNVQLPWDEENHFCTSLCVGILASGFTRDGV